MTDGVHRVEVVDRLDRGTLPRFAERLRHAIHHAIHHAGGRAGGAP